MTTTKQRTARIDARLSEEEKELFERAATIGGYRNLTEFITTTVKQRAEEIIENQERILSSQRDKEIFFDAIINPDKANEKLQDAAKKYSELLDE